MLILQIKVPLQLHLFNHLLKLTGSNSSTAESVFEIVFSINIPVFMCEQPFTRHSLPAAQITFTGSSRKLCLFFPLLVSAVGSCRGCNPDRSLSCSFPHNDAIWTHELVCTVVATVEVPLLHLVVLFFPLKHTQTLRHVFSTHILFIRLNSVVWMHL